MQIFHYTNRANYEKITRGSTDEIGDENPRVVVAMREEGRSVYTRGKFDFVVGLQYSIISWVDRDATSAVENLLYSDARLPSPSACYVVGDGGEADS